MVNGTCTNLLNIKQPSFSDLNHVIGLHLASAFLPAAPATAALRAAAAAPPSQDTKGSGGGEAAFVVVRGGGGEGFFGVEKLHWQAVVLAVEKI